MTKIAVFVGSLREKSFNKSLAHSLEKLAPEGMEFQYVDINLPLFNQDLEVNYPAEAQVIKDIVESADGVLFVTPEYSRSVPGVLKNAIDWASRPWGTNSFNEKPAGIVGASGGPVGTAVAQSDLRHILSFLNVRLMGQPEIYMANSDDNFDEAGDLIDERWRKNITAYINAFSDHINLYKK
jgi:chromate reductase